MTQIHVRHRGAYSSLGGLLRDSIGSDPLGLLREKIGNAMKKAIYVLPASACLIAVSSNANAQQDAFLFGALQPPVLNGSNMSVTIKDWFLAPGTTYILAVESNLSNDLTNCYNPNIAFTANIPSFDGGYDGANTLTFPKPTVAAGYFLLINYDAYNGPYVKFTSPSDNSTVNGVLQLSAKITDLFASQSAELLIDGSSYATITNGPVNFTVDTTKIPNGPHVFEIDAIGYPVTLQDTYYTNDDNSVVTVSNAFQPTSSALLTNLMTENAFAADYIPQNFSASYGGQLLPLQFETTSTTPTIFTLDIADAASNPIKSLSITNTGPGAFLVNWDLTDTNGIPVPLGTYNFTAGLFDASSVQSGILPTQTILRKPAKAGLNSTGDPIGIPIHFLTTLQPTVYAARTSLFRCRCTPSNFGWESAASLLASYICDSTAMPSAGGIGVYQFGAGGYPRCNDPNSPYVFEFNADVAGFYDCVTNLYNNHIIYFGHASPQSFGGPGDNIYITTSVFDSTVGKVLGNTYSPNPRSGLKYTFGKRVRFADINGCTTGDGVMNWYFGTPKLGVWDSNLAPSVYWGWSGLITYTGLWMPNSPQERLYMGFQYSWEDFLGYPSPNPPGPGVRVAMNNELSYSGVPPTQIVLIGPAYMQWLDCEY